MNNAAVSPALPNSLSWAMAIINLSVSNSGAKIQDKA
jgi:hypothetical protein